MALSDTCITWFKGEWHTGNVPLMGAADHGMWQGTGVFDGARHFEGVTPDLDLHSARVVRSAEAMGMTPPVDGETIDALIREGIQRIGADKALYLRPMMWSVHGEANILVADPESTEFAICLEEIAMPTPGDMSLTVSPFRRPRQDTAMTEAKAACLYPNNARMLREANARGFKNTLTLDLDDNVAETASTNIFMVRDGEVLTPAHNGTFLNGITRQRVIKLMKENGFSVAETTLKVADFEAADEIFMTGNASKVMPVTQLEDRQLNAGPVTQRARELYWDYAHSR